jgi:hypothetical protein
VSEEKKYEIFKENFKAGVYGDKDLLLLKGVDLVSINFYSFVIKLCK